jgi:thioredoxin-dependent peroxiredoxin
MVEIGSDAPSFCLPAADGREVCLGDAAGKWTVLFFYIKDDTPG